MSDAVVIATLTLVGVVLSALIAGAITLVVQLTKWHADNRLLWLWNRQLVDQIYSGVGPPPAAPPDRLFD